VQVADDHNNSIFHRKPDSIITHTNPVKVIASAELLYARKVLESTRFLDILNLLPDAV
jgi:hypothetical protein